MKNYKEKSTSFVTIKMIINFEKSNAKRTFSLSLFMIKYPINSKHVCFMKIQIIYHVADSNVIFGEAHKEISKYRVI